MRRFLLFLSILTLIFGCSPKESFFSKEGKLLRECRKSALNQIPRDGKIDDIKEGIIYASGLSLFGQKVYVRFLCDESGFARQMDLDSLYSF